MRGTDGLSGKSLPAQLTFFRPPQPGQKIRYPSEKVCEHTAKQYDNNGTGEREWPALVRQLNDLTTDYMD